MINKVFFIILVFIGGFGFLGIMLAHGLMVNQNWDRSTDPCLIMGNYNDSTTFSTSSQLGETNYTTSGTPTSSQAIGISSIFTTSSKILCYVSNMGAYSHNIGKIIGLNEIVIEIFQWIFMFFITFGIFWLLYYVISAVKGLVLGG